jgi:hypothetical protein
LPYRRFIAQALSVPRQTHVDYFRARLADVDQTTAPFGAVDVRGDGRELHEASECLPEALCTRLRARAQRAGVLPAALFHLAWAWVLAACVDRDDVVFGTVLSGRLQGVAGSDRALGVFINTLPIRVRLQDHDTGSLADADAALRAAVTEINAGRKQVYSDTAAKTGVTIEAAGEATARQLIARVPSGQFYKPLGGVWSKK